MDDYYTVFQKKDLEPMVANTWKDYMQKKAAA